MDTYYTYHPELGERQYEEEQRVLTETAADAEAYFFAVVDAACDDNARAAALEQFETEEG